MKKIVTLTVIIFMTCAVFLVIFSSVTTYKVEVVVSAIQSGAVSTGMEVMERRSVSGGLGSGRSSTIVTWVNKVIGREKFDDMDEFVLSNAASDIRIMVYHRKGDAAEIEIIPNVVLSAEALAIKSHILTVLPDMSCNVKIP